MVFGWDPGRGARVFWAGAPEERVILGKMETWFWPQAIFSVMRSLKLHGESKLGEWRGEKDPCSLSWVGFAPLSGRIFLLTHFLLAFDKWEYLYHFPEWPPLLGVMRKWKSLLSALRYSDIKMESRVLSWAFCCQGALCKEEVQLVGVKVSVRMKAIAVTNVSLGTRAGSSVASYRMDRVLVEPLSLLQVHTPRPRWSGSLRQSPHLGWNHVDNDSVNGEVSPWTPSPTLAS